MSSELHGRFDRIDLRELGMSVLFAAIVLFVAAMVMLSRNVSQISESYGWVQKSNTVLQRLYAVELKIWGVEMSVRGYAISQDAMFLHVYRYNRDKLVEKTKSLGYLVQSEPALQADYDKLSRLIRQHDALYNSLVALGPGHRDIIAEAITNASKRQPRNLAVATLNEMRNKEQHLLAERQSAAEHRAKSTYRLAIGIAGLAFLAGTLGFTLTLFGRRREERAEHAKGLSSRQRSGIERPHTRRP
jgi:CHASE3 domain sensor protein